MRIKQLDAFRAVAILLAITHHYGRPAPTLPLGLDRALGAVSLALLVVWGGAAVACRTRRRAGRRSARRRPFPSTAAHLPVRRAARDRDARRDGALPVGVYSYSVYPWHVPLSAWVFAHLVGAEPATGAYFLDLAAYVLTSIVAGVLSAKLIEQPALRLRERLFPAPARPATQTIAPRDETTGAAPAFGDRFAATEATAGGGVSSGR